MERGMRGIGPQDEAQTSKRKL